jgi:hypothetical protein
MLWRWIRGSKGLQTLEWVAIGLVVVALLAALAFGLRRTEAGLGEALSAAVSAWFRCLIGQGDCPLMAVRIEKAGPCWTQPVGCLARWGDCLLQGACEGADPKDLLGLLPWLAVVGIPTGGVVFALLPPWVRRRRWAWPRLTLPPPRVPRGRIPSGSFPTPSSSRRISPPVSRKPASQSSAPFPKETPPPDPGSGPHGIRPPTREDYVIHNLFYYIGKFYLSMRGFHHAKDHLDHYLGNSGKDYYVSPEEMLHDMPDFKQEATYRFYQFLNKIHEKINQNYKGEPIEFRMDSEWYLHYAPDGTDWYYAVGGFSFAYTAHVRVEPPPPGEDRPQVHIRYYLHVWDRYNWDLGKAIGLPILPGTQTVIERALQMAPNYQDKIYIRGGRLIIEDRALQELHRAGIAQEFNIRGTSGPYELRFSYTPNQPPSVSNPFSKPPTRRIP